MTSLSDVISEPDDVTSGVPSARRI